MNRQSEQEVFIRTWRMLSESVVTAEFRILIEDKLNEPDISGLDLAERLLARIKSVGSAIDSHALQTKPESRAKSPLIPACELLAALMTLLEPAEYGKQVKLLTVRWITTKKLESGAAGHLEYYRTDELDSFFGYLAQFLLEARLTEEQYLEYLGHLIPAIAKAASRGAISSDSAGLEMFKHESVPIDLLVSQAATISKEKQEPYTLMTSNGYRTAMAALGYAVIRKRTESVHNWMDVIRAATTSNPIAVQLPATVAQALNPDGPSEWPEDAADYARDLVTILGMLDNYAAPVSYGTDEWHQISEALKEAQARIQGLTHKTLT